MTNVSFDLAALRGKKVLVVGMARSGVSAAQLLCALGITPALSDNKDREALGSVLQDLESLACEWRLGEDPVTLLDGCAAVVISPGVPIDSPVAEGARQRHLPLIGELELGFLCLQGRVAAITGTNGKTTTTTLLGEILRHAGYRVHVVGNIGVPITSVALSSRPEDISVVEVSSFQLESVDRFAPDVAVLLNLRHDHLNRHGTFEVYAGMKRRLFAKQRPDQVAIFHADDPLVKEAARGQAAQVRWFSRLGKVSDGAFAREGQIMLARQGEAWPLMPAADLQIPGPHNLENALAAAAMAKALGVEDQPLREALQSFTGVEHRMQFVAEIAGIRYINDSKGTNVDATQQAIASVDRPTVLILGGSDKGTSFAPLAERVAGQPLIREVVLMGETSEKIKAALDEVGFSDTIPGGNSLDEVLQVATALASPGWNVLLSPACASFDMFIDYEHRGRVFQEWVRSRV